MRVRSSSRLQWPRQLVLYVALVGACVPNPTTESAAPAEDYRDQMLAKQPPAVPAAAQLVHAPAPPQQPQLEPSGQPIAPSSAPAPTARAPAALPSQIEGLLAMDPGASTSLGTPAEGRLEPGVALPLEGPGFQFNPAKSPAHRFGTVEMVQGIVRAAAQVHRRHSSEAVLGSEGALSEAKLVVGELSRRGGGDIPGHASHRSGRDVDLLFYLLDVKERPFPAKAIPIEPDGTGVDYRDLSDPADDIPVHLDVARTWTLFESLLTDPRNTIGRIYLVEHVRAMLLEHATSIDAPALAISRFSDLTCQPGFPHDDHAHLRWFCSVDDIAAGCEDTRPIYPWHREYLAQHGAAAKIAGKRKKPAPSVTTHAQAEAQAKKVSGPFDSAVVEFLKRRKSWVKKPHPGRPYCR